MNVTRIALPLLCAASVLYAQVARAQDPCAGRSASPPLLKGTTSLSQNGSYSPLGGVQVTVYRQAPVNGDTSRRDGNYCVPFSPGPPVYALFKGPNDQLPALQQLKADGATTHTVHVALLTAQAARAQGVDVVGYIQSIIDQLTSLGVSVDDKELQELNALRDRMRQLR